MTLPTGGISSRHHHLPAVVRWVDGVAVQVEVHRNAFARGRHPSLRLGRRPSGLLAFSIEGRPAQTLAATELIWHLCRHLTMPSGELRLISVADIIGTVEHFDREIDWTRVAHDYPFVLRTLELLRCLVPPFAGGGSQPAPKARQPLGGFGLRYTGWPVCRARNLRGSRERLRLIRATLTPPEWWLRLTYGTGAGAGGVWIARLRHAAFVIGSVARSVSQRG